MDHTVVHFEMPADDPERAAKFYRELFGWDIKKYGSQEEKTGQGTDKSIAGADKSSPDAGMEYWLVSTVPTDDEGKPTRAGVNGGMMRRQHPGQTPVNYVSVESVEEYAKKAKSLGAEVVMPKQPVPGMGWFVLLKDPERNVFGIWENDSKAA